MSRVKAEQHGADLLHTCYGKVLARNGFFAIAYFNVIPSVQREVWACIRQAWSL
jgi:hypothetical protein